MYINIFIQIKFIYTLHYLYVYIYTYDIYIYIYTYFLLTCDTVHEYIYIILLFFVWGIISQHIYLYNIYI